LDAVGATTRARCAVRVADRVGVARRTRAREDVERDIVVIIAPKGRCVWITNKLLRF